MTSKKDGGDAQQTANLTPSVRHLGVCPHVVFKANQNNQEYDELEFDYGVKNDPHSAKLSFLQ